MTVKDRKWPAYYWDQDSKPHRCEGPEDVQEGWLDYSPANAAEAPAPNINEAKPAPMTRDEIIAALNDGGIDFKKNAGTSALYSQLTERVKAHLTESGIAFNPAADTRTLLGLLKAPE